MENTLLVNDHILVNKLFYGIHIPYLKLRVKPFVRIKRGEIVVFTHADDKKKINYIKRCIGLPGEKLSINNGAVFINGKKLIEPYIKEQPMENFSETLIPKNNIFVMGDNRNQSEDSRTWSFLPVPEIHGKALMIYWPPNRSGILH